MRRARDGPTAERVTEGVGAEVGARLAAGQTFGPAARWAWSRDAEGKTCAYVSLDLTGLGMQGPGAAAAEGRTNYSAARHGVPPPVAAPVPVAAGPYAHGRR